MKRQRSLTEAVLIYFWFDNRIPKDIKTTTSQHLAAADNVLYCFGILPAEYAGGIFFKQVHGA
jgi:hypothetical protein